MTIKQIEGVCRELLLQTAEPSVRSVRKHLRERYGACGRTERIARVLRTITQQNSAQAPVPEGSDAALLREQLALAEVRAQRAEELERRHQDYWAARYQEKVQELEHRVAGERRSAGVSSEQYLRLYRTAVDLARRLERYEQVGTLLPPPQ